MIDDRTTRLLVVTPPADEPVSLMDAKSFLRIEHTADDVTIALAISAAREAAEQYLRVALLPQTFDYKVGSLDSVIVPLPLGPATSITSVTLYHADSIGTVLDPSYYVLSQDGYAIHFTHLPSSASAVLRYVAGLSATSSSVSSLLKQGILHHVSAMVEARDGTIPMPMASLLAYHPFRRIGL